MASQKPAELTREQRVKLLKKRVLRATFGSALLPGLGQLTLAKLVPSQRAFGLAMIVLFAGGVAGAVMHLLSGLWLFESALGSFAFGVLLRSLVLIYLFGIVDAYFCALRPDDQDAVLRRRAVGLNMLLPGAGYLLTRTWLRALMGLGVSAMVVFFAVARYHRFLDLVFVGLQLIMGAAMHQQRRIAEADERGTVEPPRPVLDPVAPAQIFVLMAVLVGLGAVGWVIARRMPSYDFAEVRSKDVQIHPRQSGIEVRIPPIKVKLLAAGEGWIAETGKSGLLFSAQHAKNIALRLGAELIMPFVRPERHALGIRRRIVAGGYKHERTKQRQVHGRTAYQMRFSRTVRGQTIDQWTVMVARDNMALLLLIECNRVRCKQAEQDLERTVLSLKLE
ncbi:MAG: hypothetical protein KC503_36375 [Myxococcales bacterium]|nr:hypothetical protein [Myxococcales bacterium]